MKILSEPWALRPLSSYEQVLTSLHLEFSTCKAHLAKVTSELGNDMIRRELQQGWALLFPWRLPTPLVLGPLAYLLYLLMNHQLIAHLILAHSNISATRMECVCVRVCTRAHVWEGVKLPYSYMMATMVTKSTIDFLSTTLLWLRTKKDTKTEPNLPLFFILINRAKYINGRLLEPSDKSDLNKRDTLRSY